VEKIANEALIKIISIFHGLSAELYLLSEFFMDFSSEHFVGYRSLLGTEVGRCLLDFSHVNKLCIT
jgi:hypothetical protein